MTKVWPDFTKAQPRGRLERAASVTRVAWRLAEKLWSRESETEPSVLREERQSAYEASYVRLFVNVILPRVFRVCAITSCLIPSKLSPKRRLETSYYTDCCSTTTYIGVDVVYLSISFFFSRFCILLFICFAIKYINATYLRLHKFFISLSKKSNRLIVLRAVQQFANQYAY